MKKLVIYYSRTKNTQKIAIEIAKKTDADIEEIIDKKDRKGVKGYMLAGKDAIQKKLTEISDAVINPNNYDLVIIGTPVWAGTMAPAIRTYLKKHRGQFHKVAFFTTQGGARRQRVFDDMDEVTDRKSVSELMLTTKEVIKENYNEKLEDFIKNLK